MAIHRLPILVIPDPALRTVANFVPRPKIYTAPIQELIVAMLHTMKHSSGIGLAAPQVGFYLRIIVMENVRSKHARDWFPRTIMINPWIVETSSSTIQRLEGCLSVPGVIAPVTRPKRVRVRYYDEQGDYCIRWVSNLFSACVQHEIDHLNGILFIDKKDLRHEDPSL